MKLALSQIRLDGGAQAREEISEETVEQYAEVIAESDDWPFPPAEAVYDGTNYWLWDGFHRVHAAERQCLAEIPVNVRPGTQDDAILLAAGANADHGKPRTPGDKRRSVLMLLAKPQWAGWSDNAIASAAKVSNHFVAKVRSESSWSVPRCDGPRKVERNGKTYEMQTANIGAKKAAPVAAPTDSAPVRESVDTDSRIAEKPSAFDADERARLEAMARGEETDVEAEETEKEVKPQKVKIGPPCFAMQFARLAVMQLEHIQDDDTERTQAFEFVRNWVATHEN